MHIFPKGKYTTLNLESLLGASTWLTGAYLIAYSSLIYLNRGGVSWAYFNHRLHGSRKNVVIV